VKNTIWVLLSIKTQSLPSETQIPPIHLSAVLDKSGSMSGEKLQYSKRAIQKLIKHLNPGKDQLNFVVYDSNVKVIFQDGDLQKKDALKEQVRAVASGSSTNLNAGLEKGVSLLLDQKIKKGEGKPIKRVFIFSDGLVNEGVCDSGKILKSVDAYVANGVTISSFGIGTDFDKVLMTNIANRGKGKFFFLDTAASIPKHVSKSIHGLLSVVGTQAVLRVRGLEGNVVTRIYGFNENALIEGADLGDLHADNTRQVLVKMELNSSSSDQVRALEFSLEFNVPKDGRGENEKKMTSSVQNQSKISGDLSLQFVNNHKLLDEENNDVVVAHAVQENAIKFAEVEDMLAKGNMKEAMAAQQQANISLAAVQSKDTSGQIATILQRSEKVLARMREDEDTEVMCRQIQCEGERQRRMSMCGYSSGEDSDCGDFDDGNGGIIFSDPNDSDDSDDSDDIYSPPPPYKS